MTDIPGTWAASWLWGLPLIVLTVLIHATGLFVIQDRIVAALERRVEVRRLLFALVLSATVLGLTALHAFEGAAWAAAYVLLGALPDVRSAMLYSLGAMTTYGHANIFLAPHWQMMGALEALNGMILFGLTTAFLFTVIQGASPERRGRRRGRERG